MANGRYAILNAGLTEVENTIVANDDFIAAAYPTTGKRCPIEVGIGDGFDNVAQQYIKYNAENGAELQRYDIPAAGQGLPE